eukprot:TRINITY_DN26828_c0_g1_i1.p1 TRINITY_DN26828_c0_g1~~TRINITY_DN26828_c0_g1_i1.p1  ORF type:complete len:274 (+),score=45.51 TRINITY_DN26828_c0_g1_i1:122-943(+)
MSQKSWFSARRLVFEGSKVVIICCIVFSASVVQLSCHRADASRRVAVVVDPASSTYRSLLSFSDRPVEDPQGLSPRQAPSSSFDREEHERLLSVFADVLESLRLEFWLTHGALQGSLHPEHRLVQSSDSVYVAIPFASLELLESESHQPGFRLPCKDCKLEFRTGDGLAVPARFVNTTSGAHVDVIRFLRTSIQRQAAIQNSDGPISKPQTVQMPALQAFFGRDCVSCKHGLLEIDAGVVYPIRRNCLLGSRIFPCPRAAEIYVDAWRSTLAL